MDSTFQAPPPPPPGEMMPPGQMSGSPTEPPKKKNKALIIILVVVALLLLCCCGAGIAVYVLGFDADELLDDVPVAAPASPADPIPAEPSPNAPDGDDYDTAWADFSPVLTQPIPLANARQERIASEIADVITPGFEVVEVRVSPGAEEADAFIADFYLVLVRSPRDAAVELALDFQAASEAWVDDGASWDTSDLETTEILDVLPDGTEYVYWEDLFRHLREGTAGDDYHALLSRSAVDWPGSVNTWVDYFDDGEVVEGYTYPSTWEQFIDADSYAGFEGAYELSDGAWAMFSWDFWEIEPE